MTHSFTVEVANIVGIEKAIILENIAFWLKKNIANKKHIHDGYAWTYNTYEAFASLFPYMKINTIKRVLRELERDGHIVARSDLNESSWDRTKWYTISKHSTVRNFILDGEKNNYREEEKSHSFNEADKKQQIKNRDNKQKNTKKSKFEKFKALLLENLKAKKLMTFANKINSKAEDTLKEIDEDRHEQIVLDYTAYIDRNRNMSARLEKWLVAYLEGNLEAIEYGGGKAESRSGANPHKRGTIAYDLWELATAKKNEVEVEVVEAVEWGH